MIALINLSITHGIHDDKYAYTDDFTLLQGDKVKIVNNGETLYGIFLEYEYDENVNPDYDGVTLLKESELIRYHSQMEVNLLNNPIKLTDKAVRIYRNRCRNNYNERYRVIKSKLTRNLLLAKERKIFYDTERKEFNYIYGSLVIKYKQGYICAVYNHKGLNQDYKKDMVKYNRLNEILNLGA